jgi:hypothetical protein
MCAVHREIRSAGQYRVTLGPSKLYLDDVQDILSTLKSYAAESTKRRHRFALNKRTPNVISLVAGDATVDSVEDLADVTREELNHVSIICGSPRITIDLWRHNAEVITDRGDDLTRALADDVASFVETKYSWLVALRMRLPQYWAPAFICVALGALLYAGPIDSLLIGAGVFVIALAVAGVVRIEQRLHREGSVRIVPFKGGEERRTTTRARRDVLIAAMGAISGAIVAGLAGLWAGLLSK